MSRRSEWKKAREGMLAQTNENRGVEARENIPDINCGLCKNFSENAYSSDGRGFCRILKVGSDINAEAPVYVMEGEASFMTVFNKDAAKCKYYVKMDLVDTDGTECADPSYRRAQRQMEKILK